MIILGLNAYHGDSSACIFNDGKLIAAIEEERLKRIKHWAGLPLLSIQFCLKEAGLSLKEIDLITISKDPQAKLFQKFIHIIKYGILFSALKDRKQSSQNVKKLKIDLTNALGYELDDIKAKVRYIEHHRCHMACSYYNSPFQNAAIVSLDGMGDFTSLMTGVGKDNTILPLKSISYPHSIGYFYTCFTQFLGFHNYGDEYKVMGLSSYGQPQAEMLEKLYDVIKLKRNGLFELNTKYLSRVGKGDWNSIDKNGKPIIKNKFSKYLLEIFGKPRQNGEDILQHHKDLAASVQKVTEETVFHVIQNVHKETGLDYLCLSGGVAQNSVLNGKILSNTPFKKLFVPPNAHDGGTSVGSALYEYQHNLKNARIATINQTYTGNKYSNLAIEKYLNNLNLGPFHHANVEDDFLFDFVCDALIAGQIVGWFQGRSEFGPRALGNRSILADPRNKNTRNHINSKIKRRESFRPFAPSILNEYVSDYFENDESTPFMEKVFKIREGKQDEIPAVCHIDGTGRLQTVKQEDNPRYYKLLSAFYYKTGTPILLNTSFNENEPIVNAPEEAFQCFKRTEMDILVMENHILSRKPITLNNQEHRILTKNE